MALGADVEITELGGYMPLIPFAPLETVFADAASEIVGSENVITTPSHFGGSTDAADLASLKPLVHANIGGWQGELHGIDYDAYDAYSAYILPAKLFANTVIDLLFNGAIKAKQILDDFKPIYRCKKEYIQAHKSFIEDL
jgi:ABC-type iron transport system FetAB ATPase subunit